VGRGVRAGVGGGTTGAVFGRDQYVPLLHLIVRKSFEIVPVTWPPLTIPQSVLSVPGPTKLPVAVAPCSLVNETEVPL
jgi:hypothetical protein